MLEQTIDFERRFGGVKRLYGEQGFAKLQAAHIIVVGVGGVGSWAAEALARNAVGKLTLIDLDNVAESNFNRQLHAIDDNIGKAKVTAMHERILSINPQCYVHEIEDFITPENIHALLNKPYSGIIDCVDDAKAKVAIALYCKAHHIPLIMSGGAGGRLDPTHIQNADLAHVHGDKLLAKVRNQLRKHHGYPQGYSSPSENKKTQKLGIQCIYSNELVRKPIAESCQINDGISGLNCAGYGSSVSVTATFGLTAAQMMLNQLLS